jgi:2-polyprenyl-3-methyl-5-hydroxy-6-metoxy-1,4-benzoquinol methylase
LQGLTYEVADLNTTELPAETYDIVYAHASLHHVFQLEHLFDQIKKTLKPNGFLSSSVNRSFTNAVSAASSAVS